MAINTTAAAALVGQYQKYFMKDFLKHNINTLSLAQFAQNGTLPKNTGATTVRYTKPGAADGTLPQALTEGQAPTNFTSLSLTFIDAPLTQYGGVVKLTDVLSMTSLFDHAKQAMVRIKEEAALHADTLLRNILTPTTGGATKRYAQATGSFNGLVAASGTSANAKVQDILDCCTRLKVNLAPKAAANKYVGVIPPQVTRDLMLDTIWVNVKSYSDKEPLYNGEIGSLYGVKILEATNPFQEANVNNTEGQFSAGGPIFTSIVAGQQAYGMPAIAGGSPVSPQVIITNTPDSGNPLNQFTTIGYKVYWNQVLLDPTWVIALRSKSNFS